MAPANSPVVISPTGAITVPPGVNVALLINNTGTAPLTFTLPAGAFADQVFEMKRFGTGAFSVAAVMDGVSNASLATGSGIPTPFQALDNIALRWAAGPPSWIVR